MDPALEQATPAAVGFTIIGQQHETSFSSTDPGATQWTVRFRTPSGTESFVTLPDADYPEKVAELIVARVKDIEAVARLGQPATGA